MYSGKKKFLRTKFYQTRGIRSAFGSIPDEHGLLIDLKERGLDGLCEGTKWKHQWLLFPEWSDSVQTGGKRYIICLNCQEFSHL